MGRSLETPNDTKIQPFEKGRRAAATMDRPRRRPEKAAWAWQAATRPWTRDSSKIEGVNGFDMAKMWPRGRGHLKPGPCAQLARDSGPILSAALMSGGTRCIVCMHPKKQRTKIEIARFRAGSAVSVSHLVRSFELLLWKCLVRSARPHPDGRPPVKGRHVVSPFSDDFIYLYKTSKVHTACAMLEKGTHRSHKHTY